MPATLYLVPTPIGNLEDITLRALRVLREVDLIACEDTRHTRKLLSHYEINRLVVSCHEHNERERADRLLNDLRAGRSVALVSDAGTPGISDPGSFVVKSVIAAGFPVVALPGACAATTALAASGLDTAGFHFVGFAPPKKQARLKAFEDAGTIRTTLVFYEAPHRLRAFLEDALETFGNRPAVVARELSKQFEEFVRLPLAEMSKHFAEREPRGEMVVLIAGHDPEAERTVSSGVEKSVREAVESLMTEKGVGQGAALKILAQQRGVSKRELYKQFHEDEEEKGRKGEEAKGEKGETIL